MIDILVSKENLKLLFGKVKNLGKGFQKDLLYRSSRTHFLIVK
jgi:hypothetical protein